jgi:5-formyltetrahydrofolate cyclo-ligase
MSAADDLARIKTALRIRMRRWRRSFVQTTAGPHASERICSEVMALPEWSTARLVALYSSLPGEVDVGGLAERGVKVCWPVVIGPGQPLEWRQGGDWRPGPFGILEPGAGAPAVRPSDIDLVVVPGLAFDRFGARLGQGGGFYDRSLVQIPGLRVGVAFDGQLVSRVPCGPQDVGMDVVVTEQGAKKRDGSASMRSAEP